MILQILIAVLVSCLILMIEHYWPWVPILGRKLSRIEAYVSGVLALVLPFSVLLALWARWTELITIWSIIAAGGLTTVLLYGLDGWLSARIRAEAAEIAEEQIKDGTLAQE